MPSAPKLRCILRYERLREILRQCHAKTFRTSDHDIHAARKFHIKLHCIGHCRNDDHHAVVGRIPIKQRLHNDIQAVCDYDLLQQSPANPHIAADKVFTPDILALRKRLCSIAVHTDRTFHDDREETQEECKLRNVFLRFNLLPIHIRHVTDRRKRVKRDAKWQQEPPHRKPESKVHRPEKCIQILCKKSAVLHHKQHAKQQPDTHDQNRFSAFFLTSRNQPSCQIGDCSCAKQIYN